MAKSYTSPIEEIAKRLEKEAGIHPFHMSLDNERARFGFPPEIHMTMAQQLQQATLPVGGRQQFKPHANDAQFFDSPTIPDNAFDPNKIQSNSTNLGDFRRQGANEFDPTKVQTNSSQLGDSRPERNGPEFTSKTSNATRLGDSRNKQIQLPASSTIQQAAYWRERQYLVVSFKSGHSYDYSGVELLKMLQWEQAASAGSFFYKNIRMSYPYRKLG